MSGVLSGKRVIVYGVGAMGAIITRLLFEKGVEIVGSIGRSPTKVGRDLGDVAGLGKTLGVEVENDPDRVLSRGADVAVVCVSSYLDAMHDHFARCLKHGVNVVTIEEETVFPWTTAPEHARSLDALAKENGVTLAASGAQDVFWLNLVTTLLGASHRVDKVVGHCTWNVDDYGPEVANHLHIGHAKDEFDRFVATSGWPEFVARQTLEALVSRLDLSVKSISSDVTPIARSEAIYCGSLGVEIPPGSMTGTVDRTVVTTREGPQFEFTMEGRVYRDGETDSNHWQVFGEPNLQLSNSEASYRFTTCSTLVNRIPDVIGAAPGLCSLDKMCTPSYKHR
ncbi:NAD(P)H-dependent amine dehydrogenase family protein [Ruegeria hyattellae]|uniref:NAD(P)H-dependent amine dehydrogenase family protein n=1 Tax=Ruegeria hyattellae TaxID=3233337 RepID=UPI00355B356D